MVGDNSFYNPRLKPSVHYKVCDDMINSAGSLSSNKGGIINCWNHSKTKLEIYKKFTFKTFLFASKSSKFMLKSPTKIISLCEFCFSRERERERERERF